MNSFLLDVNAVLALLDPMHVHHEAAQQWYVSRSPLRIIFCSHVENGVIRIASRPKYPNCLGTSAKVRDALVKFREQVNVTHCSKEISLLDPKILLKPGLLTPSHVTDLYLLALAAANGIRLATFDRRIPSKAVAGGIDAMEIIPV